MQLVVCSHMYVCSGFQSMCMRGCAATSQTTQQAVDPSLVHQALHDSFHCVLCHVYLRIALLAMPRHPRDAAGVPSTDGEGGCTCM
jgi:hypothetical protein